MMNEEKTRYYLDTKNRFVIENYNWAEPFSSFFPGIGGKWGVPLWIYYVNRVQAISSMGVRDKDNAIMEFFPFNKACQLVGNQGFRTFLKTADGCLYEPFRPSEDEKISQRMIISAEELELSEINSDLGIQITVDYFPLVNLPVAGLVRRVSIRNQRKKRLKIELIDGLPLILPFGMNQHCIKFIARHIEAMMQVDTVDGAPLFRLKQVPLDTPQVQKVAGCNFYFTFLSDQRNILKDSYAVDPESIFGVSGGFEYPWIFEKKDIEKILDSDQMYENKTPCAFTLLSLDIPGDDEIVFYSIMGNTSSEERLKNFKGHIVKKGVIEEKREENRRIIREIEDNIATVSSNKNFDSYCAQTFLDNVLRGGLPVVFKTQGSKSIFYLYSRKHGDLERDYNYFVLEQTYLSQGNSHFRDVNQNRRNDVWFNPLIEDSNIITFFNLIQTDGFNPLVVNGLTYTAEDVPALKEWLGKIVKDPESFRDLLEMVKKPFTPGEFIMKIEETGSGTSNYDEIVAAMLSFCKENDVGEPHEGYWIDHWTYNMDLIDNFLMIFPDRLREILVDKYVYTFYDNPDIVMPRSKKYVLVDGTARQHGAVIRDRDKINLIKSRKEYPYRVRTEYGKGKIYSTNLLVKILSIIANKISSLDPEGIGVEMEADKPGWYDPLNGMPGLMASSICETLELIRTCSFLSDTISTIKMNDDESVSLFEDLYIFIIDLMEAIEERLRSLDEHRAFVFWDKSHRIKEDYREKTRLGVSRKDVKVKISTVKDFLNKSIKLLDSIFSEIPRDKLFHKNGVCYTYFLNEVKRKEISSTGSGSPIVTPLEFKQKPVSLFLEGPVHLLKVKKESASEIYRSVKNSEIYDRELRMYKTSESIEREPFEIGRARAYPPGWIENESIYLHMEYKFLLELLKAGLYEEYYEEIKNTMMPFLNPETYGRSILENSSFIVSSAFPDSTLHGRGFQPRLTGASAELLNMWLIMAAGERPFSVDREDRLKLRLEPVLPSWFFTEREEVYRTYDGEGRAVEATVPANCFAFKFLGKTVVVYHNDERKDTFGKDRAGIASYILKYADGTTGESQGEVLDTPLANDVRDGRVERIDAFLH